MMNHPPQQRALRSDVPLSTYEALADNWLDLPQLRDAQKKVLKLVGEGKDTLVIQPTGSGKSLLFILPALQMPEGSIVLVISPLLALMKDQVDNLKSKVPGCASINSSMSSQDERDVWQALENNEIRLLYISPEKLAIDSFRERLYRSAKVEMIALDEAHCVSQWGHQFRPDYRKILDHIRLWPDALRLALTATATAKVRDDICRAFFDKSPVVVSGSILRKNIITRVHRYATKAGRIEGLFDRLIDIERPAIVYAGTRGQVEELYQQCRSYDFSSFVYHGGLTHEQRLQNQNDFQNCREGVMIATNAFGMGIDRSDLRSVLHACMPATIEAYVQEIGRAGRDGKRSYAEMFFCRSDYGLQKFILEKSYVDTAQSLKIMNFLTKVDQNLDCYSVDQVVNHLAKRLAQPKSTIEQIMQMLVRERWLQLRQKVDATTGDVFPFLSWPEAPTQNFASFLVNYENRKTEALAKLQKMYQYCLTGSKKRLEDYFS